MSAPIAWSVVERQLRTELDRRLLTLETVHPDELRREQGYIAALRFALDIPEEIQRDIERKASSSPPHY